MDKLTVAKEPGPDRTQNTSQIGTGSSSPTNCRQSLAFKVMLKKQLQYCKPNQIHATFLLVTYGTRSLLTYHVVHSVIVMILAGSRVHKV